MWRAAVARRGAQGGGAAIIASIHTCVDVV